MLKEELRFTVYVPRLFFSGVRQLTFTRFLYLICVAKLIVMGLHGTHDLNDRCEIGALFICHLVLFCLWLLDR